MRESNDDTRIYEGKSYKYRSNVNIDFSKADAAQKQFKLNLRLFIMYRWRVGGVFVKESADGREYIYIAC